MIALDTTVIVRLIVEDDARQFAIACRLVSDDDTFVPLTVTLECEWVLRSFYKFAPDRIATAIDALTDLGRISFEQVDGVRWALDRLRAGADFADMIHIVQSKVAGMDGFATFDEAIKIAAGRSSPLSISTLA